MPTPTKPKPRKPSQKAVDAALALATEKWGTQAAVLKQMGYKPDSNTILRMKNGEATDKNTRALYDALEREGVDTSKLPPMYPDEEAAAREQTWRQEWLWIGEMLHEYAPPLYEQNVEKLRELARVLARQAGHENEMFRPT